MTACVMQKMKCVNLHAHAIFFQCVKSNVEKLSRDKLEHKSYVGSNKYTSQIYE